MSVRQQIGGGVAWMAAGNWLEQAINFGVFVLLARLLGAEAFGLVAMAAAFVILSEFLVRESLSEYLIAAQDLKTGHLNAAFWLLAGLGTVLMLVLIAGSGVLAAFYRQPSVQGLIWALSPTVLLVALGAVPVAIMRRDLKFRSLSLRAIAGVAAGGLVAVTMALNGFGVWSLAGQRLAQVATNTAIVWAAVNWRPGVSSSRQDYRDVLHFGSKVLSLRGAELARMQVPTIIIGAVLGPTTLGLFSIAWRIVEIASMLIVTPLRMVSQPAFAAMSRSGGNAAGLLVDISRLSGLVALPAFVGLAVLSAPVLDLLFGEKWQGAAPILSILVFIGIYLCIEKIHEAYCLASARAGALAMLGWVEVAVGVALIWVASGWGILAMSWAFVASFWILWIVRFYIVAGIARIPVRALISVHLLPVACSGVMAAAVHLVIGGLDGSSPLVRTIVGALVGAGMFGTLTLFLMRSRIVLVKSFLARSE